MGNVGNNSVSIYHLHSSETTAVICGQRHTHLCGVATAQPSTNHGPYTPSNTSVKI